MRSDSTWSCLHAGPKRFHVTTGSELVASGVRVTSYLSPFSTHWILLPREDLVSFSPALSDDRSLAHIVGTVNYPTLTTIALITVRLISMRLKSIYPHCTISLPYLEQRPIALCSHCPTMGLCPRYGRKVVCRIWSLGDKIKIYHSNNILSMIYLYRQIS